MTSSSAPMTKPSRRVLGSAGLIRELQSSRSAAARASSPWGDQAWRFDHAATRRPARGRRRTPVAAPVTTTSSRTPPRTGTNVWLRGSAGVAVGTTTGGSGPLAGSRGQRALYLETRTVTAGLAWVGGRRGPAGGGGGTRPRGGPSWRGRWGGGTGRHGGARPAS